MQWGLSLPTTTVSEVARGVVEEESTCAMRSCELPAMPGGVTVRDGGSDVASADVATIGSEKGCC